MKTSKVKKLKPLDRFLYWVRERRQILIKRTNGYVKPWTDDEILQSYYFTNVRREDDKVTIWVTRNIIEPLRDDPKVVFAVITFRWFNWSDTGEVLNSHGLLTDWNTKMAVGMLTDRKNRGLQVFTGAFNISNSGSTKPKVERVCEDYIQPVWEDRQQLYDYLTDGRNRHGCQCTLADAFKALGRYPGLGGSGFMAAQVICDLAYTHVLEEADDWDTWCSWGPGSKRGMNRVYGFSEEYRMPRSDWDIRLKGLQGLIEDKVGIHLHARNVQNCLCEFSKYERALWNEGHLKRKYPGHAKDKA